MVHVLFSIILQGVFHVLMIFYETFLITC